VIDQMLENRLDLGIHRNLLGDSTGENHPPEVRSALLRRLLSKSLETAVTYRHLGDELEIQVPGSVKADAYIVRIEFETDDKTLLQSISPYSSEAAWKDLCLRGGELTRRKVGSGRSEVLLCATPVIDADGSCLRLAIQGGTPRILRVSIAGHPDV
jgi:hypothetical protein